MNQTPSESSPSSDSPQDSDQVLSDPKSPTLQAEFFGHPSGLFVLFFAELWERFSYYGMRALLVFYMIKGFLGYEDNRAYAVYGAYTALVYMTPFFGGLIADRLLGPRIAVVIGGVLMAAGHLTMTMETNLAFFIALALLIAGNGFFKPNISTMVGSLYPAGSRKRDGGFTIFYVGINLGAAMSPLLCGYIGETYGWHYGFGLATIGMLVGLAVFVMPTRLTQALILLGSVTAALGLFYFHPDNFYATAINLFVGFALLVGGLLAVVALTKGGLQSSLGRPKLELTTKPNFNLRRNTIIVLIGTAILIPVFALLVSDFSVFNNGIPVRLVSEDWISDLQANASPVFSVVLTFASEISKPAGLVLFVTGFIALVFLLLQTALLSKVARERMFVVLILTFFSMLFWAFFEQAGSSVNNFTDRNVDRVFLVERSVTTADFGEILEIQPTQEQLGYETDVRGMGVAPEILQSLEGDGPSLFTLNMLDDLRKKHEKDPSFTVAWKVYPSNEGMGIANRAAEIPASTFQSVNPGLILILGLVFTALWSILSQLSLEPSTPVKFALGLIQLGLGFAVFWLGATYANDRGMVAASWLVLGYALHTTGELCLSPVGLSMVTKLSPKHLVSTVMGGWFLATAFSQFLAAIIALFTGIGHGESGPIVFPAPIETVNVYGDVFKVIAIWASGSGVLCLILSPILTKWMHQDVEE